MKRETLSVPVHFLLKSGLMIALFFGMIPVIMSQVFDPVFTEMMNKHEFNKLLEEPEQTYTGSPYLLQEYDTGSVYLNDGRVAHKVPLRYNIYKDQFEFTYDNQVLALNTSTNYKKIILGDRVFVYEPYKYGTAVKKTHLELLYDGNYRLLVRHRVDFEPPEPAAAYKDPKPANFRNLKPDYFIGIAGKPAQSFNNAKSFTKLCECDEGKLKTFIKANKIKFNDSESLIKLFAYLNGK